MSEYFQDLLQGNHCFGCGPNNSGGLRLKSYWANETEARCEFSPQEHHSAAPTNFLNGGIIATIIDCHCICTAVAHVYKKAGRKIGEGDPIWYVTSKLNLTYLRPTPIDALAVLTASVVEETERTLQLVCTLEADGIERAKAEVIAALVPSSWMEGT